jgi:hypothetical protein
MIRIVINIWLSIFSLFAGLVVIIFIAIFSTNTRLMKYFFVGIVYQILLFWGMDKEEFFFEISKRFSNDI